jgi:hypothetical protein
MQQVVVTLGQNLAIECEALLDRDAALLTAVDHGDRLDQMRAKLQTATADGTTVIERYRFDTLDVVAAAPVRAPGRAEPRLQGHRHDDRGDLRRLRCPDRDARHAARPDVRHAPGDRRSLAQRSPSCPDGTRPDGGQARRSPARTSIARRFSVGPTGRPSADRTRTTAGRRS